MSTLQIFKEWIKKKKNEMKENLEILMSLLTGHMTKAERTWGILKMSKIYIKPLMYIKLCFASLGWLSWISLDFLLSFYSCKHQPFTHDNIKLVRHTFKKIAVWTLHDLQAYSRWEVGQKVTPTSFSPVTSTNVGTSPKTYWILVLTLSLHWYKIQGHT